MSPGAAPPVLLVSGLEVRYRDRPVLRDLDLSIEAGAIFGLLGPNGAGKTTLIRTICGRLKPAKGSISIAGEPNQRRSGLRRVGLVPQEIALYGHLTVHENMTAFGRLSGLSRSATRDAIGWAREAAHLEARMDDRVDILSGGWKRRVNIAAAILHRPALLILDEPTVGVDVDARNELHDVILGLSQAGMGVLIATHDLDQAETLCSTVGFLRDGVISPQGPPRTLIETVFSGHKEVIIELRAGLNADQRGLIAGSGFAGSNSDMTWSILGEAGHANADVLGQQFERLGIAVKEIRVREPGLDSLFVHLAHRRDETPNSTGGARLP